MPARHVLLPAASAAANMTEADLQRTVLRLARMLHWEAVHAWTSVHTAAGWPDLALCRPPRLLLAELKRDTGRVSAAQAHWLGMLERCPGVEVYLWRPADLRNDEILRVLT
jgi:hypothetical protein